MLTAEEKRRFLKTLEKDEEFRLAVAGLVGLSEVLKELRDLRKSFEALYQKSIEHDKRFERLEKKMIQHDKRFEVLERKLLEHDKRFEAIEKKLLQHDKRFEAIEKKLLEHDQRLKAVELKLLEHDKRFDRIERRLDRLELEMGALSESFYSFAFWSELREEVRERGENIVEKRRNARVNGEDIDLLVVTNRSVYVVEVKTKPKKRDVTELLKKARRIAEAYKKLRVVPILAGTLIGDDVEEYAHKKKVKVFYL